MTIRRFIPDFFTSMNLVCGIIGVVFAFKARFDLAFYLMMAAAVFDFLDGFVARALGVVSDFGKELDSLCDMVSFGVLPSVMLYSIMKVCMFGESWVCWIPLVIAVFSGLRLARFNTDNVEKDSFLGLPTPICALICASLCYFICYNPACFLADWAAGKVFIPLLAVCLSWLLVSHIPMFSMKFHSYDSSILKKKRIIFVALVVAVIVVCAVCRLNWSLVVLFSLLCYIVKNIIYAIVKI